MDWRVAILANASIDRAKFDGRSGGFYLLILLLFSWNQLINFASPVTSPSEYDNVFFHTNGLDLIYKYLI